jgi:hypothetical protein
VRGAQYVRSDDFGDHRTLDPIYGLSMQLGKVTSDLVVAGDQIDFGDSAAQSDTSMEVGQSAVCLGG